MTKEKAFITVAAWGPYDSGEVTSYCLFTETSPNESKDSAAEVSEQQTVRRWKVMRVEMRVNKHKDKRLIVFRQPEADERFVDTFHDFIHEEAAE